MWTMIKSAISSDDSEQERLLFAWETLSPGHKPPRQQGLKLKIGIHHLMASAEWVLSDDWKLWRHAQWGSRMNPFRVLRSAAFNTMPREKLFAQFKSFSCCCCYLHLWCGDCNRQSSEQANWKMVYPSWSYSLEEMSDGLFTQSSASS